MKTYYCLLILFLTALTCKSQQKSEVAFDAPDQVLWHSKSKSWFVSNLGGGISLARDGYGWVTRLDKDGKVIKAQWIKGLDAPSGMISTDDKLFVCDRTGVLQVDIESGKIDNLFLIPNPEFINDIAISSTGDLFVSDFFANKIYKIPSDTRIPEVFMEFKNSPDGLYMNNDRLMVVTWGNIIDKSTFGTSEKGTLFEVDIHTKAVKPFFKDARKIGNLEGLTKSVKGDYYITDWMVGKLLKVNKRGVKEVLSGLQNPTDPDYSKELNVIAFPEHTGNRVIFYHLD